MENCIYLYFAAEGDENDEDGGDNKDGIKKEGAASVKQEKDAAGNVIAASMADKKDGQAAAIKSEKELKEAQRAKELKIAESEAVRDLKAQLK